MLKQKVILLGLVVSLICFARFSFASSQSAYQSPKSLRSAIALAIILNAKTRSKDIQIQSLHEVSLAAKAEQYPSGSINCSTSRLAGHSNFDGRNYQNNYALNNCSISASLTLWDGGANRHNYRAAVAFEKAMESRFNSTSPLILYTKGSLANTTLNAYINLIFARQSLVRKDYDLKFLNSISALAKSDEDKNRIQTFRQSVEASKAQSQAQYDKAASDFKYTVTLPPSEELEGFAASIASLDIPETPDQAMQVALEKSPDIQATNYGLEAAGELYKSARAALGPQLTLNVSRSSYLQTASEFSGRYSEDLGMVSLDLYIPLSASKYHYTNAQRKARDAAELDRDAALDDARHDIDTTYQQLHTQINLESIYAKNFLDAQKIIDDILLQTQTPKGTALSVQYSLDQLDSLENAYRRWQESQSEIVGLKYSVQQVIGTLFEVNTYQN